MIAAHPPPIFTFSSSQSPPSPSLSPQASHHPSPILCPNQQHHSQPKFNETNHAQSTKVIVHHFHSVHYWPSDRSNLPRPSFSRSFFVPLEFPMFISAVTATCASYPISSTTTPSPLSPPTLKSTSLPTSRLSSHRALIRPVFSVTQSSRPHHSFSPSPSPPYCTNTKARSNIISEVFNTSWGINKVLDFRQIIPTTAICIISVIPEGLRNIDAVLIG